MNLPDEKRDQVAEVLVRARFRGLGGMTEAEACRYLADALAPLLAEWLAEARAEVVARVGAIHERAPADSPFNREGRDVCNVCMDGIHPADWPCATLNALRDRADVLDAGDGDEEGL